MKKEIWKPIIGFEGYYEISNIGRIKSLAKEWITGERWGIRKKEESFLKFGKRVAPHGVYFSVTLCVDREKSYFLVHRLVALHFVLNPNNYNVVNHLDSETTNNCDDNLEWTTTKGNVIHSFIHGYRVPIKGEKHGRSKLKENEVIEIKKILKIGGLTHKEIGDMYGISRNVITRIKSGSRWSHIH